MPLTLDTFIDTQKQPPQQPQRAPVPSLNLDSYLDSIEAQKNAPKPSSMLPDPEAADQLATATARAVAEYVTQPVAGPQLVTPEQAAAAHPQPPVMATPFYRQPGTSVYRGPNGASVNVEGTNPTQPQESFGSLAKRVAMTPIIKPEDVDSAFPFLVGPFRIHAGLLKAAAGMTSPGMAAVGAGTAGLGALPGLTAKIASTGLSWYFATQAGKALADKYPQMKAAVKAKDWQTALELGGAGVADAAMFYGAGKHALGNALDIPADVIARSKARTLAEDEADAAKPTASITGREPYRPPATQNSPSNEAEKAEPAGSTPLNLDTFLALRQPPPPEKPNVQTTEATSENQPARGAKQGSGTAETQPAPGSEVQPETRQITQGGPDIKLNEFHANRGGFANPARLVLSSPAKLSAEDIQGNFFRGHKIAVEKLTPSVFTSQGDPNTQSFRVQFLGPHGTAIDTPPGVEETFGLAPGQGFTDRPVTGIPRARTESEPAPEIDRSVASEPDRTQAAREPATSALYGRDVNIAVPGESTNYPARYSVREASDVHPSHNSFSFEPNADYEHRNDRDYRNNAQLSALVAEHAGEKFNPEFMTADSPTAEHGAPVIDSRGNVLGGNSRAMSLNRVDRFNPEGARAYRNTLRARAASLGFDSGDLDRFQQPRLVRELTSPADPQTAITDFNKGGPAALSPAERAVADGRRLSTSTVNELSGMLSDVGEGSTLAQALRGDHGAEIVNHLVDDGIVTPQEKTGLLDERGVLTTEAKDRIARMLVGRLFDSPAAYNSAPPELRSKLERVAPHVLRVEDRPDWSITTTVREAVNALADARAHGIKNLDDLSRQQSIGRGREYSPNALAIAQTLKKPPLAAAQAFRRYANDEALSREGGQVSFFTPPSREEAFSDAFKPSVFGNERGAVSPDLLSLGARQFWSDDVAPKLAAAARGIVDTADDILKMVAPGLRSEEADRGALILRTNLADLARRWDQAVFALRDARRALARMPIADRYEFIRRVESGEKQESPELDDIARVVREMLDSSRDRIRGLGRGALDKYIEDYFPHIWADPKRASEIFASYFKRGPIEGNKGFLKQRTIPTFEEGIKAGLKPVSDNPIDLVLATVRQMEKFLSAHNTLDDWKASGLAQYVDARTGVAPAGWVKIADPIGTVYGPSVQNISEYPNRDTYRTLTKLADDLGLKHDRGFQIGGPALGYARRLGDPDISIRHGTAEDVLAHEIGHHLDWKYGLGDRFENYPGGDVAARIKAANKALWTKGATPEARRAARETIASLKAEIAKRGTIKQELRALADLREGRKEYIRNRAEKMAAMAQAWVGAPEKFRRVAPTVHAEFTRFLDEHPELAPLRNIEGGMTHASISQPYDVGGLVIRGHWWAPEGAARILNNHLQPGLSQYALFRATMALNNELNLFNLGLSGFHAIKTAFEAVVSKGAIGVEAALRGHPLEAAKNLVAAPAAPFTSFMRGDKMLREWYEPGTQGALIGKLMDSLTSGGARALMDETYRTQIGDSLMEALRKGNVIGAALRLPFAAMEVPTRIIMDDIVPRMKMGTMADMAEADMKRLGPDASFDDVRRTMAEIVNSVDNRMGEVARDNLFWNRYARDLMMFLMRADQYFLGTVRELGGGAVDVVRQPVNAMRGKPVNLKRVSYVASMLMTHMAASAIYQYLHTGKWPEEGEDWFYPRNGLLDENGHPQRVSLWSYVKDVDSLRRDAVRTLENKTAPALSMISELIRNRDFYNTEIRHPDDPISDQAKDVGKFVGRQFEPRSVENFERERKLGAPPASEVEQFVGISPAPSDINQSPAERLAHRLAAANADAATRTKEAADRRELLESLRRSVRAGKRTPPEVIAARQAGKLSKADVSRAILGARRTPLQAVFNELGVYDAIRVYGEASTDEKKQLRPMLVKKGRAAMEAAAPADRSKVAGSLMAALAGNAACTLSRGKN